MRALDLVQSAVSAVSGLLSGNREPPPGALVYDQTQVTRWIFEWTPSMLRTAELQAALGDVSIITALCDAMLKDDRLRAVLDTRVQALLGLRLSFQEGTGRRRKTALRAAEAESDYADIFPEDQLSNLVLWGLLMNRGFGRNTWWEKDRTGEIVPRYRNGRIVPRFVSWHPRALRRDRLSRRWMARVQTEEGPGLLYTEIPIEVGTGEWVLCSPYGGDGDPIRGLWVALAFLWLLKLYALRDWGNLSANLGNPIKLIEFALGQGVDTTKFGTQPERDALVQKIFALGKRGILSLPPGFTMRLMSAPATSQEMFEAQINMVNTAYAVTVNGQNLTAEVKGGSLAAAKVGDEVRSDKRRFDASVEASTAREQTLTTWAAINFGDPEAAPWPVRDTEPAEDLAAKARAWDGVANAVVKFESKGWALDRTSVRETFGIPIKDQETSSGDAGTTNG